MTMKMGTNNASGIICALGMSFLCFSIYQLIISIPFRFYVCFEARGLRSDMCMIAWTPFFFLHVFIYILTIDLNSIFSFYHNHNHHNHYNIQFLTPHHRFTAPPRVLKPVFLLVHDSPLHPEMCVWAIILAFLSYFFFPLKMCVQAIVHVFSLFIYYSYIVSKHVYLYYSIWIIVIDSFLCH
jgi:hypothetical protein